jgi:hypothetical protein
MSGWFWGIIIIKVLTVFLAVGGAIWLMSIGKDGWGWLLFVAILLTPSISTCAAPKAGD